MDPESYSGSDGQLTTKQWPWPFFGATLALWSALELLPWSNHWAGHRRLLYTVHFLLHITVWLRNGLLLCRIREDNTSKRQFFWFVASSWDTLEKAMATHSSTLAWKIPWTDEPGGLQSMGLLGVGHDWTTSLWLFTFMHWRRIWQPIPVFLPGESQGRRSLVGCHLWGRTESDMTEAT